MSEENNGSEQQDSGETSACTWSGSATPSTTANCTASSRKNGHSGQLTTTIQHNGNGNRTAKHTIPSRCELLQQVLERLRERRLFLLREQGPLSFVVRSEDEEHPSRVTLSSIAPSKCCSCKRARSGICLHIVFVLVRVFKVDANDSILLDTILSERQLQNLTEHRQRLKESTHDGRSNSVANKNGKDKEEQETKAMTVCKGSKPMRKLEPGELCPICQMDITPDELLTYCHSCEKHTHVKCMKAWAEHLDSNKESVTCPLCRHDWGDPSEVLERLQEDIREKSRQKPKNVHFGVSCRGCKTKPIYGYRYRCVLCRDADLCSRCFHKCRHKGHVLVRRENPRYPHWLPAQRDCDGTSEMQPLPQSFRDLETREITHDDYDRLLELDRLHREPDLLKYLFQYFLLRKNTSNMCHHSCVNTECSKCGATVRQEKGCALPCHHNIHEVSFVVDTYLIT